MFRAQSSFQARQNRPTYRQDGRAPGRFGVAKNRVARTIRNAGPGFSLAIVGFIIIAVIGVCVVGFNFFAQTQTGTASSCVVTDKDRTTNQDGESQMRVYTENCGVFVVQDSLVHMQFNSADIYGSIQVGETYDFETYGFRIPILSIFPGITSATQV